MFIDSNTHLDIDIFDEDREDSYVLYEYLTSEVGKILRKEVGITIKSIIDREEEIIKGMAKNASKDKPKNVSANSKSKKVSG